MIFLNILYSNVSNYQNQPVFFNQPTLQNKYGVPSQPKLFINASRTMNKMHFEENEIPFETLEQFGLTHEMIEDLPVRVINDIVEGRRTPVLPIQVADEQGNIIKSRTRFALVRKDDGNVDVLFYPELEEADLSRFNEQERTLLESGKSIIATVEDKNGNMVRSYVQLDSETKQVLSAPTQVIGRNLQLIADEIYLSETEANSLGNGEPVTFVRYDVDDAITVGIDLHERTGVRIAPGDARMWSEQRSREWDKFTFGIYGCWTMDEDGNLDYVKEEDYTDELWNEQKKAGMRAFGHGR